MGKKVVFVLILAVGFLSSASVLKKRDAIQDTQTEPTTYQAKVKEHTEGKKGPPAPTFELFPKQRFLVEGPMEKPKSIEKWSSFSALKGDGGGKDEEAKAWEWEDIKEDDQKDDSGKQ